MNNKTVKVRVAICLETELKLNKSFIDELNNSSPICLGQFLKNSLILLGRPISEDDVYDFQFDILEEKEIMA